jgi:hypothetical protein
MNDKLTSLSIMMLGIAVVILSYGLNKKTRQVDEIYKQLEENLIIDSLHNECFKVIDVRLDNETN